MPAVNASLRTGLTDIDSDRSTVAQWVRSTEEGKKFFILQDEEKQPEK
jgi:hypothetical protein